MYFFKARRLKQKASFWFHWHPAGALSSFPKLLGGKVYAHLILPLSLEPGKHRKC